jgi:hypothetical protein
MRRTAPLIHVIRALVSGLAVALLLEAAGLAIWAERLDVGMLRNVAQPVTQAWERVVTAVHLDLPRRAALDLREHWSGMLMPVAEAPAVEESPPSVNTNNAYNKTQNKAHNKAQNNEHNDAKSHAGHPTVKTQQKATADPQQKSASSQTQATAATTVQALPTTTPVLPSMQVALVGDSMMAVGLAPVLRRTMATQSGVRFVRAYRSGTGLGRPDVFNWPEQYPQLIGAARPGLVICSMGANDAQNFQLDRTVYVFGTPPWKQVYADRVRQFARLLTRDGARVLWVGMPVMRENGFARRMASVNSLVKEVLTEFPQITWIDPNPYIAGQGGSFQQYLRDQRGKLVRLRADDGIHLSEDGAAYLVPAISGWMERTAKDNKGG